MRDLDPVPRRRLLPFGGSSSDFADSSTAFSTDYLPRGLEPHYMKRREKSSYDYIYYVADATDDVIGRYGPKVENPRFRTITNTNTSYITARDHSPSDPFLVSPRHTKVGGDFTSPGGSPRKDPQKHWFKKTHENTPVLEQTGKRTRIYAQE